MSYDIDPQDIFRRILCHHDGSGSLWEVFSQGEFESQNRDGEIDDVTGIKIYEDAFKEEGML